MKEKKQGPPGCADGPVEGDDTGERAGMAPLKGRGVRHES